MPARAAIVPVFSLVQSMALVAGVAAGLGAPAPVAYAEDVTTGANLPIKRITLYRSGVGSFERRGLIEGDARVQFRFNADQINDILKSMVVLDLSRGQGSIEGISYASKEPLARRLASFGINISDNPSAGELLQRLRGTPVRLRMPEGEVAGVIMNVENRPTIFQGTANSQTTRHDLPWINLLTDNGVRSYNLTSATGFEIMDKALADELNKALAVLAEYRADRTKTVEIGLRGQGSREIMVGYVQETPVWKTSYRLVLPDAPKPEGPDKPGTFTLQGWAIVENTTDEDWSGVRLALVSGRPVSFRMDLYEPLFTFRPEVPVPTIPGVMPRVYAGGTGGDEFQLKQALQSRRTAGGGAKDASSMPAMEARAAAPMGQPAAPGSGAIRDRAISGEDIANYAAAAQAQGVFEGEVFQFELQSPVTVERQKSAMLPILAAGVEGRRVSIYNASDASEHPMRGVELRNTSGMQLMPGPISVYDGAAYAGDAQIGHVPDGDKRLIAYSVDLDVEVTRSESYSENVRRVRFVNGLLEMTKLQQNLSKYEFTNKDKVRGRTLVVEQARLHGWDLKAPSKPGELTKDMYRFELAMEPGKRAGLDVVQERTDVQGMAFTDVALETLLSYSRSGQCSQAVVDAFREAAKRQAAIADAQRAINELEAERATITNDQTRIRQNMGGLDRNTELYARYVKTLNEQETRLEAITRQAADQRVKLKGLQDDLNKYISTLNVE